jgi:molybdate transport repressor ModE-like protein
MKTGAVIVAAGLPEREEDFKPMLKIGSITVIQRLVLTLQQAMVDPIVIVTGNQADILERSIGKQGVIFLRNREYSETEMFDSARIGLQYIKDGCDQVLFTPADIPLFTAQTVQKLINSGARIAVPVCDGQDGHPILIANELLEEVLRYQGKEGLRGALRQLQEDICRLTVDDQGALFEFDESDRYQELLASHNRQLLRPMIKVTLAREQPFFDQNSVILLKLIEKTESVRTACSQMNLSYSKGWSMLNLMEEQLGYPVLTRHPGGLNGGYSTLSKEGKHLIDCFEQFQKKVNAAAQDIYKQIFELD